MSVRIRCGHRRRENDPGMVAVQGMSPTGRCREVLVRQGVDDEGSCDKAGKHNPGRAVQDFRLVAGWRVPGQRQALGLPGQFFRVRAKIGYNRGYKTCPDPAARQTHNRKK